jgi:hypothetical protein
MFHNVPSEQQVQSFAVTNRSISKEEDLGIAAFESLFIGISKVRCAAICPENLVFAFAKL